MHGICIAQQLDRYERFVSLLLTLTRREAPYRSDTLKMYGKEATTTHADFYVPI